VPKAPQIPFWHFWHLLTLGILKVALSGKRRATHPEDGG
jgi:hypothetical protein